MDFSTIGSVTSYMKSMELETKFKKKRGKFMEVRYFDNSATTRIKEDIIVIKIIDNLKILSLA